MKVWQSLGVFFMSKVKLRILKLFFFNNFFNKSRSEFIYNQSLELYFCS